MKKLLAFVLLFLFWCSKPIQAVTDPLATTNNRFGIHVLELDDLKAAADLVNSNGGQWGYVTLVIRQNDQNHDKWQTIFDKCRELKLIPIIRLATYPKDDYWVKPELSQIQSWVSFLDSLNWVVQNRYIILFNEPNHQKEWGNHINPQEYVKVTKAFYQQLKASSNDYFILPAGFDTAAPNSQTTMVATNYWQQMLKEDPNIFTLFDGWNSHSYPNPGFSGSVTGSGLGSLSSYQAEVNYLSRFGLSTNTPVFITETGWIHRDGKVLGATTNPTTALSNFFVKAYTKVWTKPNLVAITPFVLNYPQPPFDQFAWQKPGSQDFYPHYYAVQDLDKNIGQPTQIHQSQINDTNIPDKLIDSSEYQLAIVFKNTGQSIWNPDDFFIKVSGDFDQESIIVSSVNLTKPDQELTLTLKLTTPSTPGEYNLNFQLTNNQTPFGEQYQKTIKIIPPPNLIVKAKRLFLKDNKETSYQLLIYDEQQKLVKEHTLSLINQVSKPIKLYGLIPDAFYRFVLLKDKYLPRQVIQKLNPTTTQIKFKTLLPLDFNQDGKFSFRDLIPWLK